MPTGHPSLGSPFAHRYLVVLAVPVVVGLLTLLWFLFVRYVPQQLVQGRRTFQSAMRARVAGELGWTLMGNMLSTMDLIYYPIAAKSSSATCRAGSGSGPGSSAASNLCE